MSSCYQYYDYCGIQFLDNCMPPLAVYPGGLGVNEEAMALEVGIYGSSPPDLPYRDKATLYF